METLKTRIEIENGIHIFILFRGSISNEVAKWYSIPEESLGNFLIRIGAEIDRTIRTLEKLNELGIRTK